jgi:DNA-nicking Smr family endonuclease
VATKDNRALFREAVRDVRPLKAKHRAPSAQAVRPVRPAESSLRSESLGASAVDDALEARYHESFLRAGLQRDVLRKLRRGDWPVQDALDLHGLTVAQADESLSRFLSRCTKRGARCVRIVHGKGLRSPDKEPVLRTKLRAWLPKQAEVLAFCQARPNDGGSGAMLVLLAAKE